MSQKFRGWENIYQVGTRKFKRNTDKLILLVHWRLIMNNKFKTTGLSSEKFTTDSDYNHKSEILQDGWNNGPIYNIRYLNEGVLYILVGFEMHNSFFIYLLQPGEERISQIGVKIIETLNSNAKMDQIKIPNIFNDHENLINTIQNDLIDDVKKKI